MATSNLPGSWRYLQDASPQMLQAFELSRLNFAANLRKQLEVLISQYLEEALAALFARSLLNQLQPARASSANASATSPTDSLDNSGANTALFLPQHAEIRPQTPSQSRPALLLIDPPASPRRHRPV